MTTFMQHALEAISPFQVHCSFLYCGELCVSYNDRVNVIDVHACIQVWAYNHRQYINVLVKQMNKCAVKKMSKVGFNNTVQHQWMCH